MYKNLFSEIIGRIYIFTIYVHNHGILVSLPSIVCYFNGQGCFAYATRTVQQYASTFMFRVKTSQNKMWHRLKEVRSIPCEFCEPDRAIIIKV